MREVSKLYYSEDHEWLDVVGDEAYIGISDFAQEELGDIVYVDLPEVGDEIEKGEDFGAIESVKAASDVYMPVSGTILEVNTILEDEPNLLNENPNENWIIKIKLKDASEINSLLNYEQYTKFCEE